MLTAGTFLNGLNSYRLKRFSLNNHEVVDEVGESTHLTLYLAE